MQVNTSLCANTSISSSSLRFEDMDKFNFVRDGESKLPPGFRFQPTDEEIVFQYLARKIFSHPLPASVIPEMDIFNSDPSHLPGNWEQDRYFFANRRPNHHRNSVVNRSRGCVGFWKVTGSDKQIICSKRTPIVGIKKTLVFFKGKHPCAKRTDWFMHVYCVAVSGNAASNIHHKKLHSQCSLIQIGKSVLCHIFSKRSIIKAEVYGRQQSCHRFMTELTDDTESSSSALSSSDSDSSVMSEVTSSTSNSEADISSP